MYIELYVNSSLGSDFNCGTLSKPYKTVKKAVDVLNEILSERKNGEEYTFAVMLSNSVHIVDSPIKIKNTNARIVFKPYDDMYASICGSVRIDNRNFEILGGGLFKFKSDFKIKDLYLNGKKMKISKDDKSDFCDYSFIPDYKSGIYLCKVPGDIDIKYASVEYASSLNIFELYRAENIIFENIDFARCCISDSEHKSSVFYMENCRNINAYRCRFSSINSHVFYSESTSAGLCISDCEFSDSFGEAVAVNEDVNICNNYFESLHSSCGYIVSVNNCKIADISHNTFKDIDCGGINIDNNEFSLIKFGYNRFENFSEIPLMLNKIDYIHLNDDSAFFENNYYNGKKIFDCQAFFSSDNDLKKKTGYRKKIKNYGDIL